MPLRTAPAERRRAKIVAAKFLEPDATLAEVAAVANVSVATAQRALQPVNDVTAEIAERWKDQQVKRARAAIEIHAPVEKRMKRLGQLIRQNEHKPTALNALIHADNLDGVLQKGESGANTPVNAPLFSLPPGTEILMRASTPSLKSSPSTE